MIRNPPINRIRYVFKTYGKGKDRRVALDVASIALQMMGGDRWVGTMYSTYEDAFEDQKPKRWGAPTMSRWGSLEEWRAHMLSDLERFLEDKLPPTHPYDFLLPWAARELARLRKAVRRGEASQRDYDDAVTRLDMRGTVLGQWADEENIDLSRTSLAEALEASWAWVQESPTDAAAQGTVIYEFKDGYSIQMLRTEEELQDEGDVMGHCVGNYCEDVQDFETVVLSLRDDKNRPHATIEWRRRPGTSEAEIEEVVSFLEFYVGQIPELDMSYGRFEQIRGKGNEIPLEKYRVYIREFIEKRFRGDPLGMLMVAGDDEVGTISFKGKELKGVEFDVDYQWSGVNFRAADFSGAFLEECRIGGDRQRWNGISFIGAEVEHCYLGTMEQCDLRGLQMRRGVIRGDFWRCDFTGCHLLNVRVEGPSIFFYCDLSKATIERCNFASPKLGELRDLVRLERGFPTGKTADTQFEACDLTSVTFLDTRIYDVLFDDCEWKGARWEGPVRSFNPTPSSERAAMGRRSILKLRVMLTNNDFRQAHPSLVEAFREGSRIDSGNNVWPAER